MFGIDVSGWVEQHRSRELYEVVREPVQNALDTGSDLYVRVDYGDQSVTVEDYGDGVDDLSQFYDIFAGDKQYDPEKRGRFGRGVKEFIGASDETVIASTGGALRYKLERYGVTVDTTKPAYTSQGCSRTDCDCVDEDNRDGKHFECLECGYTVNSDYNAAKNVGFRYLSEELSSPASHTCSSGQATSQLALMSGTLSPTGEFAEHDWVSTDKPQPPRASGSSSARAK